MLNAILPSEWLPLENVKGYENLNPIEPTVGGFSVKQDEFYIAMWRSDFSAANVLRLMIQGETFVDALAMTGYCESEYNEAACQKFALDNLKMFFSMKMEKWKMWLGESGIDRQIRGLLAKCRDRSEFIGPRSYEVFLHPLHEQADKFKKGGRWRNRKAPKITPLRSDAGSSFDGAGYVHAPYSEEVVDWPEVARINKKRKADKADLLKPSEYPTKIKFKSYGINSQNDADAFFDRLGVPVASGINSGHLIKFAQRCAQRAIVMACSPVRSNNRIWTEGHCVLRYANLLQSDALSERLVRGHLLPCDRYSATLVFTSLKVFKNEGYHIEELPLVAEADRVAFRVEGPAELFTVQALAIGVEMAEIHGPELYCI